MLSQWLGSGDKKLEWQKEGQVNNIDAVASSKESSFVLCLGGYSNKD